MSDNNNDSKNNRQNSSASNQSNVTNNNGKSDFVDGAKGVADDSKAGSNANGKHFNPVKSGGNKLANAAKSAGGKIAENAPGVGQMLRAKNAFDKARNGVNKAKNGYNKVKSDGLGKAAKDALNPFNRLSFLNNKKGKSDDSSKESPDKSVDGEKDTEASENETQEGEGDGLATGSLGGVQKVATTVRRIITLFTLLPFILALVTIFIFVMIFVVFIVVILGLYNSSEDTENLANNSGGVCSYYVDGKTVSNVKVKLLKCEGNSYIEGEELIDFEDYITGVVYQENGDGSYESFKAQAIAARSYALTRPKVMGGNYGVSLKEENGQWILSLRSCTNDQVFCNPDKGCWSLRKGGQTSDSNKADWPNCTVYSGYDESKPWKNPPLPADSKIRQAVKDTEGQVLLDNNGNIFNADFNNSNQIKWNNMAASGKDATEILISDYGKGKKVSVANCTSDSADGPVSADVASIMNWGQNEAWQNLVGKGYSVNTPSVSSSTMNSRITSIEVPMRKWTGSGHNPRTNTKKVMQSIRVNKAIAPLWKAFFEDVYANAPDFVIGSFDGCYNYRNKTSGNGLSAHAYGVACDINAGTKGNGYGDSSYSKEKWEKLPDNKAKYQVIYKGSKVVQIAHKYTLINGSDWSRPHDAMHFSFIGDTNRDFAIKCKGKVSC